MIAAYSIAVLADMLDMFRTMGRGVACGDDLRS